PLQAQQARAVVEPLPAVAGAARGEQAHLLVMAQGAAGDAGAADDLLDRPLPGRAPWRLHGSSSRRSPSVRSRSFRLTSRQAQGVFRRTTTPAGPCGARTAGVVRGGVCRKGLQA